MKKIILTVIITAVICISGTALAVSGINANQVTYTDTNNNATTVNLALDNLYNNLDSKIIMNTFGTPLYATSQGDRIGVRSISKELSKGKYLVVDTKGTSWISTATSWTNYSTSDINLGIDYENLNCTNNCLISKLGQYWNRVRPSGKVNNNYTHYSTMTFLYYVEITSNTDTITSYINEPANNLSGTSVTLIAIPIND